MNNTPQKIKSNNIWATWEVLIPSNYEFWEFEVQDNYEASPSGILSRKLENKALDELNSKIPESLKQEH